MHNFNTTESQFKEAIVQLPQLEMVFRNCTTWEATHKNQGGAYVTEGLHQKVMSDVANVKCIGCNKMDHYKSDCPIKSSRSPARLAKRRRRRRRNLIGEK